MTTFSSLSKLSSTLTALLVLTSCSPQTEHGYATHPKAIQTAMADCPDKAPSKKVSCSQLNEIAARVNSLAYKLQVDRQAYGRDILTLQETITEQRQQLEKQPDEAVLHQNLKQNERKLQEHLAVVKWIDSPR